MGARTSPCIRSCSHFGCARSAATLRTLVKEVSIYSVRGRANHSFLLEYNSRLLVRPIPAYVRNGLVATLFESFHCDR